MNLDRPAFPAIRSLSSSLEHFTRLATGINLRPYQLRAAAAILASIFGRDGCSFVLVFARQSGKDELLVNLYLYLLLRYIEQGIDIVCAQPTFKPQTVNAMERLLRRGEAFRKWGLERSAGYIFRFGQARISFFSGEAVASQVGATADRLLVMNEAQDISPAVYDKRFAPMAASGNATRVFSGTSWTSGTLLGRELRAARHAEQQDGKQRAFLVDAEEVGRANALYAAHVQAEIARLGRDHPFIRTQYFCQEIDAQAGMFHAGRLALMQGDREPQDVPLPGQITAFLVDVAGQDEARLDFETGSPGRDSTALSIVSIDLSSLETLQLPTYRVVGRHCWTGTHHLALFGQLKALAGCWNPQLIVVDATGVGEGLWAMLDRAFPGRVRPVRFSQQVKSEIGWRFLAVIETGRFRDCSGEPERAVVDLQYRLCQSEILPGPGKILRWGVPDGCRGPDGGLVHDDFVLADSLVALLDDEKWVIRYEPFTIDPPDPLDDGWLTSRPTNRRW